MKFQLLVIICASIIPLAAAILMIPKNKKTKTTNNPAPKVDVEKEKPITEEEKNIQKLNKSYDDYKNSLNEDFKRYAMKKQDRISKPQMVATSPFGRNVLSFDEMDFSKPSVSNSKMDDVVEEFKQTSPELKTLIISGFLDKKDY